MAKKKAKTKTDEPVLAEALPEEVKFHYIKGNQFRVIHVDGGTGAITPRGFVHLALYSERTAIPREGVRKFDHDAKVLGKEITTDTREGVVREMEADLIFDRKTAVEIRDWLNRRLEEFEEWDALKKETMKDK